MTFQNNDYYVCRGFLWIIFNMAECCYQSESLKKRPVVSACHEMSEIRTPAPQFYQRIVSRLIRRTWRPWTRTSRRRLWSTCLMVTPLESKRNLMKMYSMKIWAVKRVSLNLSSSWRVSTIRIHCLMDFKNMHSIQNSAEVLERAFKIFYRSGPQLKNSKEHCLCAPK